MENLRSPRRALLCDEVGSPPAVPSAFNRSMHSPGNAASTGRVPQIGRRASQLRAPTTQTLSVCTCAGSRPSGSSLPAHRSPGLLHAVAYWLGRLRASPGIAEGSASAALQSELGSCHMAPVADSAPRYAGESRRPSRFTAPQAKRFRPVVRLAGHV
jgi:hypothetical protein